MERSHLAAIRGRAQQLISLKDRAVAVASYVSADLPTARAVHLGVEAGSVRLIDTSTIVWPHELYLYAEFAEEKETIMATVQNYSALVAPLIPLLDQSAAAANGRFFSFFSSTNVAAAQQAAAELERLLENPAISSAALSITHILSRADEANRIQQLGVHLTPGVHGTPERYTVAARSSLAQALGLGIGIDSVSFDSLDRSYVIPARQLVTQIENDHNSVPNLRGQAEHIARAITAQQASELIRGLPLDALKEVTNERLRFTGLESVGVFSVLDVLSTPETTLTQVSGIGAATAKRIKGAAQTLYTEAMAAPLGSLGDTRTPELVQLLRILARFEQADQLSEEQRNRRDRLISYFRGTPRDIALIGAPFLVARTTDNPMGFDGLSSSYSSANADYEQFIEDISWANAAPQTFSTPPVTDPGESVWEDYQARPAHYQTLWSALRQVESNEAGQSALPEETLAKIRALRLDQSLLTELYLRGYQSFGAKFALVQKKVILGDEMGLGKTVQAIAAAAHIVAQAEAAEDVRILIVVPASLIVNWRREIDKFTKIPVHVAHGELKESALSTWTVNGGVLIVTYEGARSLSIPAPTMSIIDEAHFIKNPAAQRSQAVRKLIENSEYSLLMTGTPLENRLSEFRQLVTYVQPELLPQEENLRPQQFKNTIAPAYLRRNQTDVLDELPTKIEIDEWIDLTEQDLTEYKRAVAENNWMSARRAAMVVQRPLCAKVERIIELADEAASEGRNILIFSYFRDVLDRLHLEFDQRSVGIINGDVAPIKRQELVDTLGANGQDILLAQIGAGGVGLNIQKASVVILTEAQVKPALEDQAIARAHRMGQTKPVSVYRILGDETIDERLLEINAQKRKLFDEYAREATSADVHDAVDVSEAQLAQDILAAERERLGLEAIEPRDSGDIGENVVSLK
ncbi:DEAD/DEAH box helicase [Corynebacterium pseudotuberculosis]|uniref:DEAD/DEAH box helicase n=1 Tax=Corynebacterium pseudotuberculosis TaxID=1719 RepID=UPI0001DD43E8|nr:DEAD/DEAH box helicase [Corynebacterium pseudotuberculosis]ADK28948.1 ATP-dependent helicase [Corynebacterium pseudotuberculosis FRC41]ADL21036.1 DEAD/DEAH box helicase [Corynebacterium pseudotuberculosis 1002]ADO26426.1 ATP-dependent helicase [Corynebacterium pseudotuberculosis I19]AEK92489.1 SNF2 family DNA/RNA helicase [Corynebacterium pseudotuberculosis PAT10]AEX39641.1 SNF2 family DNA/RNA helicase [Corynebacterium pseudotuberculosis 3/99-5]